MSNSCARDPLTLLPSEVILRILEFVPTPSLASATRLSKAWNTFIDGTHQDAIYSDRDRNPRRDGVRDLSFLEHRTSFARYFEDIKSWKELCKRQTLLARNWDAVQPVTRESVLQVGNDPVWRFRPDFKRRFFVSTSQIGGINVTDMDSGSLLWRLSAEDVRPYAHLEYEDGTAVWDREGNSLEVWRTDVEGQTRGTFRRIVVLQHDCQTRGFQLSYGTLCVVSTEGKGFVYDVRQDPPVLTTHLEIKRDAVGHLDQNEDVVMYSMGDRGYDIYEKASSAFLGTLEPHRSQTYYHIYHPPAPAVSAPTMTRRARNDYIFPRTAASKDRLVPIEVVQGPIVRDGDDEMSIEGDEWGAGMLVGNLMVGVSRCGRVFVCCGWRNAIKSPANLNTCSYLIETESDGANFDLGGWLSVRDNRVMFEVQERVYVLALDPQGRIQDTGKPGRASYALLTSLSTELRVPVSFGTYLVPGPAVKMLSRLTCSAMALFDDCIMTTYTILGWRQHVQGQQHPRRIFPTKAIRVISLAPDIHGPNESSPRLWERPVPLGDARSAQMELLQLVGMLGDVLDDHFTALEEDN